MRYIVNLSFWIGIFFSYVCEASAMVDERQPLCCVRVLLDKHDEGDVELLWTFAAEHGFVVQDIAGKRRKEEMGCAELRVAIRGGMLWLNGHRVLTRNVQIEVKDGGHLFFQGNEYQGSFYILYRDKVWYLVNRVGLEEYVCSVLRSEGWPGWHRELEVNKLLAITIRSYVTATMLESRRRGRRSKPEMYDVCSSNIHQTYRGTHSIIKLREAVEATCSIVSVYKGKPIKAMYDICCGGVIPAHMTGVDFTAAPYLARNYACSSCVVCKAYSWEVIYTGAEVQALLGLTGVSAALSSVRITRTDKAGIVQQVVFKFGKRVVKLSGKKVYALFKDIKSGVFTVSLEKNGVRFRGRGFGHHMGLCQWGAREMIRSGMSYIEVLSFFYPGSQVQRIEIVT